MKLASVRFVAPVTVPKVVTQQSFKADARPGRRVEIDLSSASRVIYLKADARGGKPVVIGVPLERVLFFEPAPEESPTPAKPKEASAKGA